MREIKFRAFVRGYMVEVVSIDFINKYITWDDNQYDRCIPPNKCFEMESFENIQLMQFTGLHDKNGKEIYEGDWCTAMFRGKDGIQVIQGHIIMDEFMWCIDCTRCVGDDIFSINRPHNFEIIGNIYENPELLTNKPNQP